jgi:hypothetical protein
LVTSLRSIREGIEILLEMSVGKTLYPVKTGRIEKCVVSFWIKIQRRVRFVGARKDY